MKTIIFSTIFHLMMNPLEIFHFTNGGDTKKWFVVNDTVMGGESAATMAVDVEGHGMFGGHVSLDNNGGFSSVRYNAGKTKLQGFSKFVIKLKGDKKDYQFRVKTKSNEYYSYIFSFSTIGNWQTIEIPFNNMAASFRGRTLDIPNFPGEYLEEIGFLIGNKKAEDFTLLIDNISVQ